MSADASHRAFPPPDRPWVLAQSWRDLLFAHWSVPVATLRERLPAGLEPDTYDGRAWLGVVPFRMAGVHHPSWPLQPAHAEITHQTMLAGHGFPVEGEPESLLLARRIDVQTWAPRRESPSVAAVRPE